DRPALEAAAAHLEQQLDKRGGGESWVPLRALLADPDHFAIVPIPGELLPEDAPDQVYLAALIVHPERLEGAYLGGDDDAIAGERGDAVADDDDRGPATVVVIVEPKQNFIEQIPRPNPA
ncbi:MAG: hypothetical protein KC431_10430, partial [Myxococcales bacterium]|nr:hypothetical protein [Myxococcales bacterium]